MPALGQFTAAYKPRTAAHASNQLKKTGVKPLLSIVRGQKVRQPTPEDLSASPVSSSAEEEVQVAPPAPKATNGEAGSRGKRKAAPASLKAKRPRKTSTADTERTATNVTRQLGSSKASLDDDLDEDEKIFFAMRSSQTTKPKVYGSQSSYNIHAPPRTTKGLAQGRMSSVERPGFKRPRDMPDGLERPPAPTFKRPATLIESPRSSSIFRTPHSSPPTALGILSSSAPQNNDESPLSSPPPTAELEASIEAQPTSVDGVLMLPCPLCHSLVPQAFLEAFNDGRALRWKDKVGFCQAHKEQELEVQRSKQLYPTIDWAALPARMRNFHPTIEAILERRMGSYYRTILDESVATGKARNDFRAVEGDGQANAVPGYYGLRGARMMQEHILAAFATRIRRLASTDKAIPRTGPAGYVQTVLAPEMAVLLAMEDFPGIDAERARVILAESVEVGKLMADNDESFVVVDEDNGSVQEEV